MLKVFYFVIRKEEINNKKEKASSNFHRSKIPKAFALEWKLTLVYPEYEQRLGNGVLTYNKILVWLVMNQTNQTNIKYKSKALLAYIRFKGPTTCRKVWGTPQLHK